MLVMALLSLSSMILGCLARSHDWRMLEAYTVGKLGVVEINYIKKALSWIQRHSWSNVVVETDSLVCVQAIQCDLHMPSELAY
uniref:RNase H type-1 domain-containing protein n=1 Tax=Cannabis sativa TaxID=3483 RepID=A0A803Q6Y2_CANSA